MTPNAPSFTPIQPWLIALLAAIVASTPLAIDMYLPAMPALAQDLNASIGGVQQSLSIYLGAYALGMLLFGPLADALGRRPLALFGLAGFSLAGLALAFCQSLESLLALRALQAFCGSAATVVVPGIIRHLYREHTAKGMSYLSMIMMLAPMLAPSIGSGLLLLGHWPLIFFTLGGFGLLVLLLSWKYLPEISSERRSPSLGLFFDSYQLVLGHPGARPLIVSLMFSSFAFFCYVTGIAFVYIQFYGASEQLFGLLFGVNVVFLMAGNFINTRLVTHLGSLRMLRLALVSALIWALALVLVNWLQLSIGWTVVTIGPLMASLVLVSTNTDALIIMNFTKNSGTASAVNGTLRFGCGAFAGPLLASFYSGTPMPFVLLMLAGVLGVLVCQLWFYLKGAKLEGDAAGD